MTLKKKQTKTLEKQKQFSEGCEKRLLVKEKLNIQKKSWKTSSGRKRKNIEDFIEKQKKFLQNINNLDW